MKRVLIITYYWPPSGGGGVQRWLKFAKYLPEFGWQPVIYTPENPDFEIRDPGLEHDVNPSTEVIRRPIWEPFGVYRKVMGKGATQNQGVVSGKQSILGRLMVWIRANIFVPDPRKYWIKPSAKFLVTYLEKHPVDILVTTGPPHSMHLIGLQVSKVTGIPWIADFRDPWSDWDVLDLLNVSERTREKHKKLEADVFKNATVILTVSPRLSEKLKSTGGIKHVEVITNGFDETDFTGAENIRPDKFTISHLGLLNKGRNPTVLWQMLETLCEENENFRNDLKVYLAGTIEEEVKTSFSNMRYLKERILVANYISHKEVFKQYASSSLLLLLVNNTPNSKWIIPAKLFEYLNANVPILAYGGSDSYRIESDANDVLLNAGHPAFIDYQDAKETRERILDSYNKYKSIESPVNPIAIGSSKSVQYARKTLSKRLADLLENISLKK